MKALLVGGTGPTGPYLARGLIERGYEVTLFHRGVHELDDLPPMEHIHGDPHFPETIAAALGDRTWDLVLATYGRIRYLAEALAGRCDRFLAVGGIAAFRGFTQPERLRPHGMRIPSRETDGEATDPPAEDDRAARFSHLIWSSEKRVFDLQSAGAFSASYFRYPRIYGPRQLNPVEWSVVRRVLDGRPWMILPDGGLSISARSAAVNAAQTVLLAVDHPKESAGQVYNVADDEQWSMRQWVELVAGFAGGSLPVMSLPDAIAKPARAIIPFYGPAAHHILDLSKARADLGYQDRVPAREALREAVEWLLENPVTPEKYPGFRDPFDYAAEDRLVADYERAIDRLDRDHPFELPGVMHSYAHPRQPTGSVDHRGR